MRRVLRPPGVSVWPVSPVFAQITGRDFGSSVIGIPPRVSSAQKLVSVEIDEVICFKTRSH